MAFSKIKHSTQHSLTLFELWLSVAVITVVAGIVIIVINPGRNLGDKHNSQRSADVIAILDAVHRYGLENNGVLPATIKMTAREICAATGTTCTSPSTADLGEVLAGNKYLKDIPKDPLCPSACLSNGAGYTILRDANGRVTVSAPNAEQGKTIKVTR